MFKASLISRPKLNLCGTHYGVQLGDHTVLDPQRGGVQTITTEQFSKGMPVNIEATRELGFFELHALKEMVQNFKYDFVDHNCEHFSRGIVEKKKESRQIQFVFIAALAFFSLWLLSSKK